MRTSRKSVVRTVTIAIVAAIFGFLLIVTMRIPLGIVNPYFESRFGGNLTKLGGSKVAPDQTNAQRTASMRQPQSIDDAKRLMVGARMQGNTDLAKAYLASALSDDYKEVSAAVSILEFCMLYSRHGMAHFEVTPLSFDEWYSKNRVSLAGLGCHHN